MGILVTPSYRPQQQQAILLKTNILNIRRFTIEQICDLSRDNSIVSTEEPSESAKLRALRAMRACVPYLKNCVLLTCYEFSAC